MTGPDRAEGTAVQYAIDSGWLVEVVDEHTCGTTAGGYYGAHEPGCGLVPVAKVEDLLARAAPPGTADTGAREAVTGSGRPSNDRDGACICDYNPDTTDGPQEECPFHGRPYAYWVERGDALEARLRAALAASPDGHQHAAEES